MLTLYNILFVTDGGNKLVSFSPSKCFHDGLIFQAKAIGRSVSLVSSNVFVKIELSRCNLRDEHSSLFCPTLCDEDKECYGIGTWPGLWILRLDFPLLSSKPPSANLIFFFFVADL